jgi:hypothetical protein
MHINGSNILAGSQFAARFYNSFVIAAMAKKAADYEEEMTRIGNGAPPLSEALHVAMMWTDVCTGGPVGEA